VTLNVSSTNQSQCICKAQYYNHNWSTNMPGLPDCRPCRVGIRCPARGTTKQNLPLLRGYWRPSTSSLDVRRCPDAAENCGSAACDNSSSGCRGGVDSSTYCAPTLEGPLCRLCKQTTDSVYYVKANGNREAKCKLCGSCIGKTIGILCGIDAGLLAVLLVLRRDKRSCPSQFQVLKRYWAATKPETKLKILIGFCAWQANSAL
jgi:hypothetical protein